MSDRIQVVAKLDGAFGQGAASFQHPASSIQHPASSIQFDRRRSGLIQMSGAR
jgi:hypothetical protein